MPRFANYTSFAQNLVALVPALPQVEMRDSSFWHLLEVNASRVLDEATDVESMENMLSPLGPGGFQTLCLWAGLESLQSKRNLKSALAEYLSLNLQIPGVQTAILINEFLYRRRVDAIEMISRLILPKAQFELIHSSDLDPNSRRFCYAILAFVQNPHYLRLLMLFEGAERAGYTRCILIPEMEISEEEAELAQQRIDQGADVAQLDVGRVDDILESFERRHGRHQSRCFEIFRDDEIEGMLVFIFRYLRESFIREVEDVIFGAEAELIVLRLYDGMRTIEEHSTSGIGMQIAAAVAWDLLEDHNVQYIEDTTLTRQDDLEELIHVLASGKDDRLRFQELYLKSAPLEEAPILILRCDKRRDLRAPLDSLRRRDLDLLQSLDDIRKLNVAFVIESARGKHKVYVFKIYCKRASPGRYFLPYSVANISTRIRSDFEKHLREGYNVRVIPGTG